MTTRREGTSVYYRVSNPKIVQACQLMREVPARAAERGEKLTIVVNRAK